MEGREERRRSARLASIAAALVVVGAVTGAGDAPNVRLAHNSERFAVARAVEAATRMLGRQGCQALLDEFADTSGRPLRASLEEVALSAPEYLGRVFFYDAPPRLCRTSALALTMPRSRAILVCGSRFVREMKGNARQAEATIIHEALHSLGLGENPPSSDHITERVLARCGER